MKTSPPALEQIILKLIESHLIHTKLLITLRKIPAKPVDHKMNLENIIFGLMGFRENEITEEFTEWYFLWIERAASEANTKDDYEHYAADLYAGLKSRIEILH